MCLCVGVEDQVDSLDDGLDSGIFPLAHMGARVQNHGVASHLRSSAKFLPKKLHSEIKGIGLYGIPEIDNIRRVNHKLADSVFCHQCGSFRDSHLRKVLAACILRCAGVNHEGIRLVGKRLLHGP